jgi:hypothetical protein
MKKMEKVEEEETKKHSLPYLKYLVMFGTGNFVVPFLFLNI